MKITTTTKKFREGVKLSGIKGDEIRWESTGYLSVRLLDAWGAHPVAKRKVTVEIPGEGKIELESDDDGKIFHPDVPFQDYELDLGDKVKVHAPAVANREEVQERHVPDVSNAYVRMLVRDIYGFPAVDDRLTLEGPDGTNIEVVTDEVGYAEYEGVLPPGTYRVKGLAGETDVELCDHGDGLSVAVLKDLE